MHLMRTWRNSITTVIMLAMVGIVYSEASGEKKVCLRYSTKRTYARQCLKRSGGRCVRWSRHKSRRRSCLKWKYGRRPECPDGRVKVAGYCCWPGQDVGMITRKCLGEPSCPLGRLAKGNDCFRGCTKGKVLQRNGRCCWLGQQWSSAKKVCVGLRIFPLNIKPCKEGCHIEGMVHIPAGWFWMGSNKGAADEMPMHKVFLGKYHIDKHEVTVKQYAKCVEAGKCRAPLKGDDYNWKKPGRENHPINGVSWFDARNYCHWAGKRLPTEAEWEKAARGTDGRTYPWGESEPSCRYAVMDDSGQNGCGRGTTWPVGQKREGRSPYGVFDMAGNLWEWVADRYDRGYYRVSADKDPKGPGHGEDRVLRGGSWFYFGYYLRTSIRLSDKPTRRHRNDGFRCAKTW